MEELSVKILLATAIIGFIGVFIGVSILIYKGCTIKPEVKVINVCENVI